MHFLFRCVTFVTDKIKIIKPMHYTKTYFKSDDAGLSGELMVEKFGDGRILIDITDSEGAEDYHIQVVLKEAEAMYLTQHIRALLDIKPTE